MKLTLRKWKMGSLNTFDYLWHDTSYFQRYHLSLNFHPISNAMKREYIYSTWNICMKGIPIFISTSAPVCYPVCWCINGWNYVVYKFDGPNAAESDAPEESTPQFRATQRIIHALEQQCCPSSVCPLCHSLSLIIRIPQYLQNWSHGSKSISLHSPPFTSQLRTRIEEQCVYVLYVPIGPLIN